MTNEQHQLKYISWAKGGGSVLIDRYPFIVDSSCTEFYHTLGTTRKMISGYNHDPSMGDFEMATT